MLNFTSGRSMSPRSTFRYLKEAPGAILSLALTNELCISHISNMAYCSPNRRGLSAAFPDHTHNLTLANVVVNASGNVVVVGKSQ